MLKALQACRGLAALLVVLFHLGLAIASHKYFGIESFGRPFLSGVLGGIFRSISDGMHLPEFACRCPAWLANPDKVRIAPAPKSGRCRRHRCSSADRCLVAV